MNESRHPPALARVVLSWVAGRSDPTIVGDLAEDFQIRLASMPLWRARLRYRWEVVYAIAFLTGRRFSRAWNRVARGNTLEGGTRTSPGTGRWGMDTWVRDMKYSIRSFLRQPTLALAAVLTIALGVGANTAVFSIVDSVLLRPLPFEAPGQLAMLWAADRTRGNDYLRVAEEDAERLTALDAITASVGLENFGLFLLNEDAQPETVDITWMKQDLFAMLGVELILGRSFSEEELESAAQVAVISHRLWRTRFGGDPDVVGKPLGNDPWPLTVIGVAPEGFRFLWGSDVWHPEKNRTHDANKLLVRLAPDVTVRSLNAQLATMAVTGADRGRLWDDLPPWLEPLQEGLVGEVRTPLTILLAAAGLILLLAGVNVANLLLTRGLSKKSEWALRTALGASRPSIVRQVVMESVLLSIVGGLVGVLFAWVSFDALLAIVPSDLPRVDEVALDSRVFLVMMTVTTLSGVMAALLPAYRAANVAPAVELKAASRGGTPGSGHRIQSFLMSAEVALGTVLVVGATVLMMTLQNLFAVDPGFRTDVLSVSMSLTSSGRIRGGSDAEYRQGWAAVLREVRALPGVESAGTATLHPMENSFYVDAQVIGNEATHSQQPAMFFPTSEGYLETVGTQLVAGRRILRSDDGESPAVVVVNEEFVRRFVGEGNPIGRQVRNFSVRTSLGRRDVAEIVGVVADVKNDGLGGETDPVVFVPLHQSAFGWSRLFLRSGGDPRELIPAIQEIVWQYDRTVTSADFEMLGDVVQESTAREGFLAQVLGVFALVGLGLAVGGVYGVVSFAVGGRTREIGIRRAIGADSGSVAGLVARWSMTRVAIGTGVGIVAAIMLGRLLQSVLFGVATTDARTIVTVAIIMLSAGALATWLPTRRAMRVDPMTALRAE